MPSGTSDAGLINLFLDMLAAEQGAGANTLDAYRRDLEDFSEFLGPTGQGFASAETQILRDYLANLDGRGFKASSVLAPAPCSAASMSMNRPISLASEVLAPEVLASLVVAVLVLAILVLEGIPR